MDQRLGGGSLMNIDDAANGEADAVPLDGFLQHTFDGPDGIDKYRGAGGSRFPLPLQKTIRM